ncbi:signal peptidase I [Glycomyces sambucus]|uniref:Signal peptidase I n=1 Tax=Glycomyces sambucus TaxID=380244 RepID=A0A1G9LAW6_9ACTN|nr:signal peptidase I [Glycomyces sambucus]SDL59024.1 signal peptidase I [Glycomyces sambucus]
MSPGSSDGAKGPRRIEWSRLPGAGEPGAPPPPGAKRPGRLPDGPVAGGRGPGIPDSGGRDSGGRTSGGRTSGGRISGSPVAGRPPADVQRRRLSEGPTGARDRVAASHDRVSAAHDRVKPARGGADDKPKKEAESRLSQPHKRQYLSLWIELPLLLVVAFSAAVLLRTFAVQPFYIPSGSMEQTLQEGDKVLVLKLTTTMRTPQRGEVVVFRGTDSWDPEYRPAGGSDSVLSDVTTAVLDLIGLAEPDEKDFIKRVIAVGGDTVMCCDADGNVVVNGVALHEDEYVYDNAPVEPEPGTCHSRRFDQVTVPEGEVWVMGDHRGNSKDSRCQGPVPVENIIGRAIALVWPTDRATELEIPGAFDALDGTTGSEGSQSASGTAGDGLPAAQGTSWDPPPSLPATATTAPAAGARARRLAP